MAISPGSEKGNVIYTNVINLRHLIMSTILWLFVRTMVVQVIKSDYHFNFLKLEINIKFKKMKIKKTP